MQKNISARFPVLLPLEKVYLEENFIRLERGSESKTIFFRDIAKVTIQPLGWIQFLYRTYDVRLTMKSGENIDLFNLTNNGREETESKILENNPETKISTLDLNGSVLFNGIIRTRNTFDGRQVPLWITTIMAIIIVLALLFLFAYIRNFS